VPEAIAVARWAFFAAATVAFGTALFAFYAATGKRTELTAANQRIVAASATVALIAGAGWLALTIVSFGATDFGSFLNIGRTILFETKFGPVWGLRLTAALMLVPIAFAPVPMAILLLSTIVLGSEAWIGHAATNGPLHQASQLVHLLAAGAWLGGLVPLERVLRAGLHDGNNAARASAVVQRFSAMGIVAVLAILASGIANGIFEVGFRLDLAKDYDRLLLAKLILFLAMVGVALFNRLRLMPALADPSGNRVALRRFLFTVAIEQALGLAALLAASLLGMSDPHA